MKRVTKIGIALVLFALTFTALMGFAHTSAGRPILVKMASLMGKQAPCPLGYDKHASLAEREQSRRKMAALYKGKNSAASPMALSFRLRETSQKEVIAWVAQNNGNCRQLKSAYEMECTGTFFESSSGTLWVEFDGAEKLVSVRGIEKFKDPTQALALFKKVREELRRQGEKSLIEEGRADRDFIAAGLLRQASVSAKFNNYAATARVSNMGAETAFSQEFLSF